MTLELTVKQRSELAELDVRSKIALMEEALNFMQADGVPGLDLPVKETFTDGVYIREMTIPADSLIIGKIHKHAHYNHITKGKVTVLTKDGLQDLEGPCSMISSAGTKRALYTHTETIWTTVHANPKGLLSFEELEEETISPDYSSFPILQGEDQQLIGVLV